MTSGPGRPLKGWIHHGEEPSGFARLDAEAFPEFEPGTRVAGRRRPRRAGPAVAARLSRHAES